MGTRVNGVDLSDGAALSDATPAALGVAAAGVSTEASRADHVHAAPAGGVTIGTAGADASRPAATTGLISSLYTATDTAVRYLCESDGSGGARWCVAGRHGTEGRDRTGVVTGGTLNATGSANITGSTVTGFALCFSLAALPAGGRLLLSVMASGPVGWQLEIGEDAGDRGLLGIFRSGLSSGRRIFTGATVTGALDTPHIIACRFNGASTVYSLDGAAVQTASDTGTATHATTPVRLNRSEINTSGPNADHLAFKLWSSALTDPDLVAISGAYATGRIPDVSGATVIADWHAARHPEWVTAQRVVRGSVPTILTWSGAPPMVIR